MVGVPNLVIVETSNTAQEKSFGRESCSCEGMGRERRRSLLQTHWERRQASRTGRGRVPRPPQSSKDKGLPCTRIRRPRHSRP
jgi:hypothetical protein